MSGTGIARQALLDEIEGRDFCLPCGINAQAARAVIPEILRGLIGSDAGAREWAVSEAKSVLWHQGTIYAASAEAMKLLPRLLSVEGSSAAADFDVSYLIALLSLSAFGARGGKSECGSKADGAGVLAALESSFEACLGLLRERDIQTGENLTVALMAIGGRENEVVEAVAGSARLSTLAEQLRGVSHERRWDIFEALGDDAGGSP